MVESLDNAIQCIVIYMLDSIIHPLNNQGLFDICLARDVLYLGAKEVLSVLIIVHCILDNVNRRCGENNG